MTERKPELLGCDDLRAGERARTDVLDPGDDRCMAVGVETYGRVGRRPAATPPDLGGAPHAAQQAVLAWRSQALAIVPAGQRGRAVVALQEMLARVGQAARLIDVDVVASPQLERIDVQRQRELVDRLLERRRAFHHAGRAKRVLGAEVGLRRERQRTHIGAAIERACGVQHGEHPASLPHRDDRIDVDRRKRAVPARTETHGLERGAASAPVELLCMTVVDESYGPAGEPRELGRSERLEACALFRAEPATDELRPHANVVLAQTERLCELVTGGEHPLRRHPGGETVAVPRRHRGVRLERGLQLRGCLERELDRHLRRGQRGLRVATCIVGRLVVNRWSLTASCGSTHGRAPRGRARARASRLRRLPGVSAATTAIGSPAYAGSAASSGARVVSERSLSGPITARTPGLARAASRSSERTRPWATGDRSTAA